MLRALKVIEENGQRDFIKFNKDFENINIEREEKKLVSNLWNKALKIIRSFGKDMIWSVIYLIENFLSKIGSRRLF